MEEGCEVQASRERVEQQLDELELLGSVFSQPGEFTADQVALEGATAWVRRITEDPPSVRLSCNLHLTVETREYEGERDEDGEEAVAESTCRGEQQCIVDIAMTLPLSYPEEPPEVYVSSDQLTRRGQDDLNSDLTQFRTTLPRGEICLLDLAEWVREHARSYRPPLAPHKPTKTAERVSEETVFCRLWLYMHHIYSKTKRRNILDLADQLGLTGFCLPGKPGVVCVEGEEEGTRQFFGVLRRWNWKSITCRHRESVPCASESELSLQRKVEGFRELEMVASGARQNHMDMGQFRDYLEGRGLGYMFQVLFGVDGHRVS